MSSDPGLTGVPGDPVPAGPPWSIDVLADLQAGVYSDDVSARLRTTIAGDAEATAVLAGLDATVDALSLLPTPRMPERFALRLDAAIAAESSTRSRSAGSAPSQQRAGAPPAFRPAGDNFFPSQPATPSFQQLTSTPPAGAVPAQFSPDDRFTGAGIPGQARAADGPMSPAAPFAPATPYPPATPLAPATPTGPDRARPADVVSLDAARARRRRWIGGLGVAAAVIVGATITLASLNHSTGGTSSAAPGPGAPAPSSTAAPNALELTPGKFQEAFQQINGAHSGPLTNPPAAAACYAVNGIAGPDILGVTAVTYRGQPASAIAVKISATQARIVVVGLDCGVNGARAALDSEIVTR